MAPTDPIRIIRHFTTGIPDVGSFEVRFSDGRESRYFYWDENPGRRSISKTAKLTREEALEAAKDLARVERDRLK